jgi:hypothetical protein
VGPRRNFVQQSPSYRAAVLVVPSVGTTFNGSYGSSLAAIRACNIRNGSGAARGQRLRKGPCAILRPILHWQGLVQRIGPTEIIYSQHVERDGKLLFQEVCERNLEGIVAKRKTSVYS